MKKADDRGEVETALGRRWTLDGEPISDIYGFFTDNDSEGPERRAVLAMELGQEMNFGSETTPVFMLRRTA